jgi:hypothetical protein
MDWDYYEAVLECDAVQEDRVDVVQRFLRSPQRSSQELVGPLMTSAAETTLVNITQCVITPSTLRRRHQNICVP